MQTALILVSGGGNDPAIRAKIQGTFVEMIQTHQTIHHHAQNEDYPTTSAHYFCLADVAPPSRIDFPLHL